MTFRDREHLQRIQARLYFAAARRELADGIAAFNAPRQDAQGGSMTNQTQDRRKTAGADRPREPKIEAEELMVVHETTPDDKGRRQKIRVVRWLVDGTRQAPRLEKRGFYWGDRARMLLTGQTETFDFEDVKILSAKLPEVLRTMEAGLV